MQLQAVSSPRAWLSGSASDPTEPQAAAGPPAAHSVVPVCIETRCSDDLGVSLTLRASCRFHGSEPDLLLGMAVVPRAPIFLALTFSWYRSAAEYQSNSDLTQIFRHNPVPFSCVALVFCINCLLCDRHVN